MATTYGSVPILEVRKKPTMNIKQCSHVVVVGLKRLSH
jgi:hypothetical protein